MQAKGTAWSRSFSSKLMSPVLFAWSMDQTVPGNRARESESCNMTLTGQPGRL